MAAIPKGAEDNPPELPQEILEIILSKLPVSELLSVRLVSRDMYVLVQHIAEKFTCLHCKRVAELTPAICNWDSTLWLCSWCINHITWQCDSCNWYDMRVHLSVWTRASLTHDGEYRVVHSKGACWHDDCAVCGLPIQNFDDAYRPSTDTCDEYDILITQVVCLECGKDDLVPFSQSWSGEGGAEYDAKRGWLRARDIIEDTFPDSPDTSIVSQIAIQPECAYCLKRLYTYDGATFDHRIQEFLCADCTLLWNGTEEWHDDEIDHLDHLTGLLQLSPAEPPPKPLFWQALAATPPVNLTSCPQEILDNISSHLPVACILALSAVSTVLWDGCRKSRFDNSCDNCGRCAELTPAIEFKKTRIWLCPYCIRCSTWKCQLCGWNDVRVYTCSEVEGDNPNISYKVHDDGRCRDLQCVDCKKHLSGYVDVNPFKAEGSAKLQLDQVRCWECSSQEIEPRFSGEFLHLPCDNAEFTDPGIEQPLRQTCEFCTGPTNENAKMVKVGEEYHQLACNHPTCKIHSDNSRSLGSFIHHIGGE